MAKPGENPSLNEAIFIAIRALSYISQSGEEISKFLATTGVEPADIIRLSENIEFLGGVLSYLCANESLLVAFCAFEDRDPNWIENARIQLQGDAV